MEIAKPINSRNNLLSNAYDGIPDHWRGSGQTIGGSVTGRNTVMEMMSRKEATNKKANPRSQHYTWFFVFASQPTPIRVLQEWQKAISELCHICSPYTFKCLNRLANVRRLCLA
jgi:hypothetical protein